MLISYHILYIDIQVGVYKLAKVKDIKVVTENEFADRILLILQSSIKKMRNDCNIVGIRSVIKGNMLSDGSGRYTVSIDAGEVYKFLIDPNI